MQKQNFIQYLENRLLEELPGFEAQKKMAPIQNNQVFRNFKAPNSYKSSAVLILLSRVDVQSGNFDQDYEILLTLRSSKLNSHSGQISFPGGRTDEGESPLETALREANEEIGLESSKIKILGNLSGLYVPPSNSLIQPIVAFWDKKEELRANPDEVEEIFYTSLNYLANEENLVVEQWDFKESKVNVPHWKIHHSTPLWGATAIILSELIELYQHYQKSYLQNPDIFSVANSNNLAIHSTQNIHI